MNDELRELIGRARIHDVMLRYASAVDRKDYERLASCFTKNAEVEYGSVYRGNPAGLIAFLREALAGFDPTMHFLGNHTCEIRGDEASAETYAIAYHRLSVPGHENDLLMAAVRYLDELVCEDGTWKIARRIVPFEWLRRDAGVLEPRG
jgi:hypothetical protein